MLDTFSRSHSVWTALIVPVLFVSHSNFANAATSIEWTSDDIVESTMLSYKYISGKKHPNKKDGANYADRDIAKKPGKPRVKDRVLKRGATITGSIKKAPAGAAKGSIRLEDNYGRILDRAEVKAPDFKFELSTKRSLHTGIYLAASLNDGKKEVWSKKASLRMQYLEKDQWREFVLGVWNMDTKPGLGKLWRKLGLSHRAVLGNNSPKFSIQNDLKYHCSNILYSVLGLYHRDYKHWRDRKAARKDPKAKGPVYLPRHVCLSSPKARNFQEVILTATAQQAKPYPPLHYSIGDEIGIGNMASPHDMCGSKWCKARYPEWLKNKYKTLEALNKQWDTEYKEWSEAEMFSNFQALGRKESGNFSPWNDRLEFMDYVMYGYIKMCDDTIRKIDPDATTNISGFQPPNAFGFDHYLLARTVNCVTPYELGESPDMLASFFDDGKRGKIYAPGFGKDGAAWISFLRGYGCAAQWDSPSKLIDLGKMALKPRARQMKVFADWVNNGPGRLRNRSERTRDKVAFLNSQAANRGNWAFELAYRPDVHNSGVHWARRDSWDSYQREMMFRVRVSWAFWTHDVGIWPKYVDTRQLGDNYLIKNGYKILIIPRAIAMSDETAAQIKAFAEAGGTVIADTLCGIMDENCKMRKKGALDDMFGVKRGSYKKLSMGKYKAGAMGIELKGRKLPFFPLEKDLATVDAKAGGSYGGAPVLMSKKVGKGQAVYLNFRLENYYVERVVGKNVENARQFLLDLLAEHGVKPVFTVSEPGNEQKFHTAGHDVCLYTNGAGYLVGVRSNPTSLNKGVGGVWKSFAEIKGNVFLKPREAQVNTPSPLYGYDVRQHKALGKVESVPFKSVPAVGGLYAFFPFQIDALKAKAQMDADKNLSITGNLAVSGGAIKDEKLVINMRVYRADGSEQDAYRYNIDCDKDRFTRTIPLGLNEKGKYKVVLTEPCSGKSIELPVELN